MEVLKKNNVNIISSGGTYKSIKKLGFKCKEISEFTQTKEMLDGRVKTLHPKIHSGILFNRLKKKHRKEMLQNKFDPIDLVVVNFYPFEETIKKHPMKKIIENIDIGGPSMVRAAAKNFNDVTIITHKQDYLELIKELKNLKAERVLILGKEWPVKLII